MAADNFKILINGKTKIKTPLQVSLGSASGEQIMATQPNGTIHPSLLPTGVGPDILVAPASENLLAGAYVNIHDVGGITKLRNADNSNNRPAHGFVKTAVTSPANGTLFYEGANDAIAGKTRASRQYLGVVGASTEIPLDPATDSTKIHQYLGFAESPTSINTDIEDCEEIL